MTAAETTTATIPARTERQAMDWSLVLASQGIEVELDREPHGPWFLRVDPADQERAEAAISQFRRENRGFDWHRELPGSELLYDARALLWAAAVAMVFLVQDHLQSGLFDTRAVRQGEWWRAFTAEWLHRDFGHLASNIALGIVFLGLAMARFGTGMALLGSLLAGALANYTAMYLRPEPYVGLGASGMVMGALGMIAAQSASLWNAGRRGTRMILTGMGTGALIFILTGSHEGSDVLAHVAGFAYGILLGGIASILRRAPTSPGNAAVKSRV